jgi:hypothetical protein
MNTVDNFPGEGGGGGECAPAVKQTSHPQQVPRLRMVELYLHSHICVHGFYIYKNYVALVRERTILTDLLPLVGEVSANPWSNGQSSWLQIQRTQV